MREKAKGTEPRYVISVAARLLGTQTHTLRYYEKIGIIEPSRSRGNIRLYSEQDIDRVKKVKAMMDDLGINLAGICVVMRMAQRISEMQEQIDELELELRKFK